MVWSLALSSYLNDAPWENGITKSELIDYAERTGAPSAVIENLQEIEYDEELFYSIEEELELIHRIRKGGSEAEQAKELLAKSCLRFIYSVAKKYKHLSRGIAPAFFYNNN